METEDDGCEGLQELHQFDTCLGDRSDCLVDNLETVSTVVGGMTRPYQKLDDDVAQEN